MSDITPGFVREWVFENSTVPYSDLSKVQLAWAYLDAAAEVERLRAELASRDEQITAVRKLHSENDPAGFSFTGCCGECQFLMPCPTIRALDGAS